MMMRELDKATETTRAGYAWELSGLKPAPEEEWGRLRAFLGLESPDIHAMLATVEPLFRRGHELVVANYAYLQQNPETAAILGWDSGVDDEHLAERRRFFTVWLARTLGMDLGHDFARYLFRAGQVHAGHGPRHIHVPPVYVTGAASLMTAAFARVLAEEMPGSPAVTPALAGWNKVFALHLHMMLAGYAIALEWDEGQFSVPVSLFGRMRALIGKSDLTLRLNPGSFLPDALRKFFNYFPQARPEALESGWEQQERVDARGTSWTVVNRIYHPRPGWRVLLNGRDSNYISPADMALHPGDEIQIFPPGR